MHDNTNWGSTVSYYITSCLLLWFDSYLAFYLAFSYLPGSLSGWHNPFLTSCFIFFLAPCLTSFSLPECLTLAFHYLLSTASFITSPFAIATLVLDSFFLLVFLVAVYLFQWLSCSHLPSLSFTFLFGFLLPCLLSFLLIFLQQS